MLELRQDETRNLVTATTDCGYDAAAAKEQMRRIIASLPARIRVSRIFKGASFGFTAAEIQGHFECVQQELNKTHIEA